MLSHVYGVSFPDHHPPNAYNPTTTALARSVVFSDNNSSRPRKPHPPAPTRVTKARHRKDQNQSSLAGIYASATSAATQIQKSHQFVQPLRSEVQAQILETPTARSVAGERHDPYWETLTTTNRSFRPWESDLCKEQFEQSSDWTQSIALDPVDFLDFLPSTAPAQSLHLDPLNFLDFLPSTAPAQSLHLDPVNFLDFLPSTAPAQPLSLDPVNFLDCLSSSTPDNQFQPTGSNNILTDSSMAEAQQSRRPNTAVHLSSPLLSRCS
jgi:hypothetical protein